jgi:Na+/melibiose symporter-like transporter
MLWTAGFRGYLLLCVVFGWMFVRQEKRTLDPMLDFTIAVRRPFLQGNLYNLLYGMGIFSVMAFVPYFAETRFGMTPAETGILLTPRSVMMMVMSTVASVWLLKYGYRWAMVIGTSVVTLGLLLIGPVR